ncbi:MAG: hypothetical protein V1663_04115 [archaeon]
MANDEFNKMLDEYMGGIRRKSSMPFSEKIKKVFKSKSKKKIHPDKDTTEEYVDISDEGLENVVIEEKMGFLEGFFGKFIGLFSVKPKKTFEEEKIVFEEPEEEPKTETEYEEPVVKEMKENFISKLFKKIFCFRKKEEPEKELELKTYGSEMDEDVVKVLNIVNELFKKLPQNVKYQFRNSKDFEIYSDILKKYHIIKKD